MLQALSGGVKRRKQNHKISFHFFSGYPHTPRRKWIGKEIFGFGLRPQGACEARRVGAGRRSARTIGFRATTHSARASVIKILRILLIQCSNFVQKTPPIFTFARNGRSENLRRGGDSNSRYPFGYTAFPRRRTRPLCDLSIQNFYYFLFFLPHNI